MIPVLLIRIRFDAEPDPRLYLKESGLQIRIQALRHLKIKVEKIVEFVICFSISVFVFDWFYQ